MFSRFLLLVLLLATHAMALVPVDFAEDVKPLLNKHCVGCHGGVKKASGLSLLSFEQATGKAKSGLSAIVPFKADESEMLKRIASADLDERMPPPEHGPSLTDEERETLERWVNEGATWKKHWAFEAPTRVEERDSKSKIDELVRAPLEEAGIAHAPPASPTEMLRRVTIDLTGLPPTPEELEAFSKNPSNEAYEAIVDALLDSPHFGERWATLWLDIARYADSEGLGIDRSQNVWKYRDWLIDAFNADKPYDEFVIEQMAGDLMPNASVNQRLATTFHRLTQSNNEGGTDDEEFRVLAVMDRVSTTWEALQGVTFGCVQCHSHPYDDFEHDEYYSFMAFFNNTADADVGEALPKLRMPLDDKDHAEASQILAKRERLQQELYEASAALARETDWKKVAFAEGKSSTGTGVEFVNDEFRATGNMAKGTEFTLGIVPPKNLFKISALRIDLLPKDPETSRHTPEWGSVLSRISLEMQAPGETKFEEVKLREVLADEPEPFYDANDSLKKGSRGAGPYSKQFKERYCIVILDEALVLAEGAKLRLKLRHDVFALGAFPLVTKRGKVWLSDSQAWSDYSSRTDIASKRQSLADLRRSEKEIDATSIPTLSERPAHLRRETRLFERGNWLEKGKLVEPGVPASFPPFPDDVPQDRLALANWMANPDNPLTSRVFVNRLWAQLFGRGIVLTLEDFGSAGEKPSHPALLDHLAIRFQEDHAWSIKSILKEMVLSNTYRQTSHVASQDYINDPDNKRLARGPRQRLTAEMVRDHALAISGLFSPKLHGKPVFPPLPKGVWTPFSGEKWNTAKRNTSDRYRRSIYVFMKRSIPFPMFATFDAPSRELCQQRRLPSNTPLQSLTLFNDEAFDECSRALALRMNKHADDLKSKLEFGYLLATSKKPEPPELEKLQSLYQQLRQQNKATEEDALAVVASVLINLDAALTK